MSGGGGEGGRDERKGGDAEWMRWLVTMEERGLCADCEGSASDAQTGEMK